jgi:Fe-S cluster biogenesis protein NfuA
MTEEIKNKIKEVITNKIRPRLLADGGDIELVEITDQGIVKVKLKGSCVGCPFSQMTLAFGVERTLKDEVQEVDHVEVVI